jgi:hypothetical protein
MLYGIWLNVLCLFCIPVYTSWLLNTLLDNIMSHSRNVLFFPSERASMIFDLLAIFIEMVKLLYQARRQYTMARYFNAVRK